MERVVTGLEDPSSHQLQQLIGSFRNGEMDKRLEREVTVTVE